MDLCKKDNLSTLHSVNIACRFVLMSSTSLSLYKVGLFPHKLYKIGLFLTSSCFTPEALWFSSK